MNRTLYESSESIVQIIRITFQIDKLLMLEHL